MQRDEAMVMLQASLDQALSRPGCMAVVSPAALAVVLASEKQEQEGEDGSQNAG